MNALPIEKRCLACGYDLRGLPEPRCPECGRAFDPDDRRTFMDHTSFAGAQRFGAWMAIVLAAFGPGWMLYVTLSGFPAAAKASAVSVLPHTLLGVFVGAVVLFRASRMLARHSMPDTTRRSLRRSLWIALPATLVSAAYVVLAVVQIVRPLLRY